MYCINCGKKVKDEDKFCMKCGCKINRINSTNNNQNKEKADGAAITSLVLGLISLLLVFSLSILVSPLYITGLIFGLTSKSKSGEKKAGIIINIINIVISIVVLIIYVILFIIIGVVAFFDKPESYEYRTDMGYSYTCKALGENDYSIALDLNQDGTYSWGKYSDYSTVIYGTYTMSSINGNTYNLELKSERIFDDGIARDYQDVLNFEMKVSSEKVSLTNKDNNTTYECEKNLNYLNEIR